jgi:hypothetical protein
VSRATRIFPDTVVEEGQVLVRVEAVAVENVDRAIVAGTHYTAAQFPAALPAIPCFEGIGRLPDGTLVGFGGLTRPMARSRSMRPCPPPIRHRSPAAGSSPGEGPAACCPARPRRWAGR